MPVCACFDLSSFLVEVMIQQLVTSCICPMYLGLAHLFFFDKIFVNLLKKNHQLVIQIFSIIFMTFFGYTVFPIKANEREKGQSLIYILFVISPRASKWIFFIFLLYRSSEQVPFSTLYNLSLSFDFISGLQEIASTQEAPRGSTIDWGSCLMQQRLLVQ